MFVFVCVLCDCHIMKENSNLWSKAAVVSVSFYYSLDILQQLRHLLFKQR